MPTLNNAHGLVIGIANYANIRNLTWESPAWPPRSAKVRTGSLQQPDDSRSLPRSLWFLLCRARPVRGEEAQHRGYDDAGELHPLVPFD